MGASAAATLAGAARGAGRVVLRRGGWSSSAFVVGVAALVLLSALGLVFHDRISKGLNNVKI